MSDSSALSVGSLDDDLIARPPDADAEFDITAMIDLVFMMNIYFLVTFITAALGELALPTAAYASALNSDNAVIISILAGSEPNTSVVYLGDGTKSEPIRDPVEQLRQISASVEQGSIDGKTDVLIKGEKNVRAREIARLVGAAVRDGMQLNMAVTEVEGKP